MLCKMAFQCHLPAPLHAIHMCMLYSCTHTQRNEEAQLRSVASQELREVRAEVEREGERERERMRRELERQLQVFREGQEDKHNKVKTHGVM